jgi:protoporphyrinogen oxidase
VRIARLSEPKAYRDSPDDPIDHTVLCAEIPATVGDDVWRATDDDLAELVRSDLGAVGMPAPSPRVVHVERRPHVYPVYRRGFEREKRRVDAWIDGLSSIVVLGRQALFAHDNTHHALLMGHAVAGCLDSGGHIDTEMWQAARAAFAEHVVED